MVPGYYAAKKKKCLGASNDRDSGRNSFSSRGKMPEQSHGVMVSTEDNIDGDNISSLIHNKVDGNRKEDTSLKDKINEEITVELKNTNETKFDLEANNEEVCLAKEFGAATLLGIGVVIRDSNGAVLASCSEKIPQAYKAEEIEALATLKALSFAFEVGFLSAMLKGDCLGLIQALKSEERNLSPTGLLIEDVKLFANNYG
nr:hypothetical protein CFP56_54640 [Quercus suber]